MFEKHYAWSKPNTSNILIPTMLCTFSCYSMTAFIVLRIIPFGIDSFNKKRKERQNKKNTLLQSHFIQQITLLAINKLRDIKAIEAVPDHNTLTKSLASSKPMTETWLYLGNRAILAILSSDAPLSPKISVF